MLMLSLSRERGLSTVYQSEMADMAFAFHSLPLSQALDSPTFLVKDIAFLRPDIYFGHDALAII
jgi:hypothetical protein